TLRRYTGLIRGRNLVNALLVHQILDKIVEENYFVSLSELFKVFAEELVAQTRLEAHHLNSPVILQAVSEDFHETLRKLAVSTVASAKHDRSWLLDLPEASNHLVLQDFVYGLLARTGFHPLSTSVAVL